MSSHPISRRTAVGAAVATLSGLAFGQTPATGTPIRVGSTLALTRAAVGHGADPQSSSETSTSSRPTSAAAGSAGRSSGS